MTHYHLKKKVFPLLLLLSLLLVTALVTAEDVTFRAAVTSSTITVGDTFQITVLLDVATGKNIKQAEFQLTPSAGASISSAATANLFTSPTFPYGATGSVPISGSRRYGEITAALSAEREGNNLVFATLTATATTAGTTTFTFSNLVAKKGTFTRTTTSVPLTITISAAAPATVCGNGQVENGELCDGSIGSATCTSVKGNGWSGTLSCTNNCRFDISGCTNTPPSNSRRSQLAACLAAMNTADNTIPTTVPTDWDGTFISRMARMFRDTFAEPR